MILDQSDRDAIVLLNKAADRVVAEKVPLTSLRVAAIKHLIDAIRHLAYPDRARYPKVRGATKGHPFERQPAG
jgi:hypothetical protein